MLKRELKYNFKSFLIWAGILIGMIVIICLAYPYVISGDEMKDIDELMNAFPPEVLEAFNMDLSSISTAYGWIKTEGFVFILLIVGSYSAILGSNILLKEESDKTIEYLNSVPISRYRIILSKYIVGLFYIILLICLLGIFTYLGLIVNEDIPKKEFLLLFLSPIFPCITLYTISMFLSTFFHKTKKLLCLSLGLVFISYILNTISLLSTKVENLKYASVFTLADVRNVITNVEIQPIMVIITIILCIGFLIPSVIRFQTKDLIS